MKALTTCVAALRLFLLASTVTALSPCEAPHEVQDVSPLLGSSNDSPDSTRTFQFFSDLRCQDYVGYGMVPKHPNDCAGLTKYIGPANARSGFFTDTNPITDYGISLGPWDKNHHPQPGHNIIKPAARECHGSPQGVMYYGKTYPNPYDTSGQ